MCDLVSKPELACILGCNLLKVGEGMMFCKYTELYLVACDIEKYRIWKKDLAKNVLGEGV